MNLHVNAYSTDETGKIIARSLNNYSCAVDSVTIKTEYKSSHWEWGTAVKYPVPYWSIQGSDLGLGAGLTKGFPQPTMSNKRSLKHRKAVSFHILFNISWASGQF
jgi:hypothetical protein